MTTTMQAVHVTQIGGPEVLQPVMIGCPIPKAGEALIKLTYSSVNFNDFMERMDYFRPFVTG